MQAEMTLINDQSKQAIELDDMLYGADYNEGLVHQVTVAFMAKSRAGTKAQKTRSQVKGGGAKPWRQKGTGRARAGTISSPLWRTGGVTFAAVPKIQFLVSINHDGHQNEWSVAT